MAGITTDSIRSYIDLPCVRCMPNAAISLGSGITAFYANNCDDSLLSSLHDIFDGTGVSLWLKDEQYMNAMTAISGSGIAYLFYFMGIMEKMAIEIGIPKEVTMSLVAQTFCGAGELIMNDLYMESERHASMSLQDRIKSISSKGGTTEAALKVLSTSNVEQEFSNAIKQAYQRAAELSIEYSK
jgi:pyrroline-5-carboxylate reductase